MNRKALGVVGFIAVLLTVAGCIPKPFKNSGGRGAANSILADIGGLSPEDRKLPNIAYALVCDDGDNQPFRVPSSATTDTEVTFPGERLKDGDVCAMEITADVPQNDGFNYRWYSSPQQPGLYYSSNKDKIVNRALNLKLYKLYGREGGDIFLAQVTAAFEVPAGETLPENNDMLANIECGVDENFVSGAPAIVVSQATQRLFTFRLSAAKMKSATCGKMVVRKKGNTGYETIYEGTLTGMLFTDPQTMTTLNFGPFTLKKSAPIDVQVQTVGAVECSVFTIQTRVCSQIKLPRAENFWLAVVSYVRADNSTGEVLVSGPAGLNLDNTGTDKSLDAIKAAASGAGGGFSFFDPNRKAGILAAEFNGALFANTALQSQSPTMLGVNNVTFTAFKEVYLHGFKEVSASELNKHASAIWFAHVEASQDTSKAEFIITGNSKYFTSSSKVANGNQSFFTWDDFKRDRDDASVHYFRAYGIKGGAVAPLPCGAELGYYINRLSNQNNDMFAPSNQNAALEACEITAFPKTFDTWTLKSTLYLWAWHSLIL